MCTTCIGRISLGPPILLALHFLFLPIALASCEPWPNGHRLRRERKCREARLASLFALVPLRHKSPDAFYRPTDCPHFRRGCFSSSFAVGSGLFGPWCGELGDCARRSHRRITARAVHKVSELVVRFDSCSGVGRNHLVVF